MLSEERERERENERDTEREEKRNSKICTRFCFILSFYKFMSKPFGLSTRSIPYYIF